MVAAVATQQAAPAALVKYRNIDVGDGAAKVGDGAVVCMVQRTVEAAPVVALGIPASAPTHVPFRASAAMEKLHHHTGHAAK
jgi:hypothetical protein